MSDIYIYDIYLIYTYLALKIHISLAVDTLIVGEQKTNNFDSEW